MNGFDDLERQLSSRVELLRPADAADRSPRRWSRQRALIATAIAFGVLGTGGAVAGVAGLGDRSTSSVEVQMEQSREAGPQVLPTIPARNATGPATTHGYRPSSKYAVLRGSADDARRAAGATSISNPPEQLVKILGVKRSTLRMLPVPDGFPGSAWAAAGPHGVCIITTNGSGCDGPRAIGPPALSGPPPFVTRDGGSLLFGLAPDGVRWVTVADGRAIRRVPVRNNAFFATYHGARRYTVPGFPTVR